jgi:hypothetical protein
MQGRNAIPRRDNWDNPAKGENPDRKSQVLQGSGGRAQGQQPRLDKKKLKLKILSQQCNAICISLTFRKIYNLYRYCTYFHIRGGTLHTHPPCTSVLIP